MGRFRSVFWVVGAVVLSFAMPTTSRAIDWAQEFEVKEGQELVLGKRPEHRPRLWTLEDMRSERAIKKRGHRRSVAAAVATGPTRRGKRAGTVLIRGSEVAAECVRHLARGFESCEPNIEVSISATPNDAFYSVLYGMKKIDADRAWDTTAGSAEVIVSVVDTGVNYHHPDLAANIAINQAEIPGNGIDDDGNGYIDDVYGYNAITGFGSGSDAGDPLDDNGHGTHVAGTIAAVGNNSIGVIGVAYGAKVLAVKALGANGSGYISDIADAIEYSVVRGARIINLSLSSSGDSSVMRTAIEEARNNGVLVVAAAGNSAKNIDVTPAYPAKYDYSNLVSVASTDSADEPSTFTNYSATSVHLAAPGTNIASTSYTGGYVYFSGTSMATPHVAGVAALVFSLRPELTGSQVKDLLLNSVDVLSSLSGLVVTGGRINAARAVALALGQEFTEKQAAVSVSQQRSGKTKVRINGRAYDAVSQAGISGETAQVTCRNKSKGSAVTSSDGTFSVLVTRPKAGQPALSCNAVVAGTSSASFKIGARK